MATLDERVAFLEGKVDEHSRGFGDLRDTVRQVEGHLLALDQKLDRLMAGASTRTDKLDENVNVRMDGLDEKVDRPIAGVHAGMDGLESTLDRLGDRMSRQFLWFVSVQIAVLMAVIGALAGR